MNLDLPNSVDFHWEEGELFCEGLSLESLAKKYGTPLYVYSKASITRAFKAYTDALQPYPHLMCYALKANSNIAIIQLLASMGSGFDIVSLGELARVKAAGADCSKVIFSGVGKTKTEIKEAILSNLKSINIESASELDRVLEVARELGCKANISFRVNPNVDAKTHPYISTGLKKNKFGVSYETAVPLYKKAALHSDLVQVVGVDCHIGSQITQIEPFLDACEKICDLLDALRSEGINLHHVDFGGGLGIRYNDEEVPAAAELIEALHTILQQRGYGKLEMIFEAGRSLVGNSGALLTEVQYTKQTEQKNFVIVDAAMNDMIRPSLYQAWMQIVPVKPTENSSDLICDVVCPVCETGDWLAKDRPLDVCQGDILALLSAGAYGMSMSSAYNSRRLCAEVLVDGKTAHLIRQRDSFEDLYRNERLL